MNLLGNGLVFDRAGRRLLVVEPDGIAVVELATNETRRIAIEGTCVAGFDDRIWIAARDRFARFDSRGRTIGDSIALQFSARCSLAPTSRSSSSPSTRTDSASPWARRRASGSSPQPRARDRRR